MDVKAPLRIKENTYFTLVDRQNSNRFRLIQFDDPNDPPPNVNIARLWQMVQYARSRADWSPKKKAMIYGAYAHVVQDLFVHMVYQPAHAGYGYNLLGFRPEDGNSFLEIYEIFFETMSPSFIPPSELETPLKLMWINLITNGSILPGEYGPMEVYRRNGQHWMSMYQDTILPWVQGFVEAFHGVGYHADGMTAERLSALLEGSAILTFLVMGYEKTNATDVTKVGWAMLHPEWSFWDVKNYESNRLAPYVGTSDLCWGALVGWVSIFLPPPLSGTLATLGMVAYLVDKLLHDEVIEYGLRGMTLPIQPFALNFDCIDDLPGGWMSYLSDTTKFDQLAACAVDLNQGKYQRYRRHIAAWQRYSTVLPPNQRSSYQGQYHLLLSSGWKAVYMDRFSAGPSSESYFDYKNHRWVFSRKAGVLGGMWDVQGNVFPQPGIFRLDFRKYGGGGKDGYVGLIYTTTPIYVEDSRNWRREVWLNYDLITFGPTLVLVKPVSDTNIALDTLRMDSVGRYQAEDPRGGWNHLRVDLSGWLAPQGPPVRRDTLFWEVKTADSLNPSAFHPMLKSDYRGPYQARPEIHNNVFYQTYFKNGDPVRRPGENPLEDPKHYWPYVLPVEPKLNAPGNPSLTLTDSGLAFSWTDRSSYETRYSVKFWLRTWGGDTITWGQKIANANGTSGFIAWSQRDLEFLEVFLYLSDMIGRRGWINLSLRGRCREGRK